jgi:hypothetical protein
MYRRSFNRGLMAASLSASPILGPCQVLASQDGEEKLSRLGRIQLRVAAGLLLIEYMFILNTTGTLFMDLRNPMRQFDENRTNIFGSLGRLSLLQMMTGALLVGTIYLHRRSIYLVPGGRDIEPARVLVAHRGMSWQPAGQPAPASIANLPTLGRLFREGKAGGAYRTRKNELLMIITPTGVRQIDDL